LNRNELSVQKPISCLPAPCSWGVGVRQWGWLGTIISQGQFFVWYWERSWQHCRSYTAQ